MSRTTFITTNIAFESYGDLFEVSTDADYVYFQNQKTDAEAIQLRIDIEDWNDIIEYIKSQLQSNG